VSSKNAQGETRCQKSFFQKKKEKEKENKKRRPSLHCSFRSWTSLPVHRWSLGAQPLNRLRLFPFWSSEDRNTKKKTKKEKKKKEKKKKKKKKSQNGKELPMGAPGRV
jgi:hypothetical protein